MIRVSQFWETLIFRRPHALLQNLGKIYHHARANLVRIFYLRIVSEHLIKGNRYPIYFNVVPVVIVDYKEIGRAHV